MKRPLHGGGKVEMRPPTFVFAVSIAAILVSIIMVLWSLPRIDSFTVVGFIVMPSTILLAFVLGIDALQRRYVFFEDKIEVRYLFRWKKYELPENVEFSSSESGQVIIRDSRDRGLLLRIPREYNHDGKLEQRLREHFIRGTRPEDPDDSQT